MKIKKILILLIIVTVFSISLPINNVQAALQSNGDEPVTKDRNTWMTQARAMETLGGGFGLSETQNEDLTSSSGANNIDIHMQKNTEFGAMALLSASSYGNPSKIEDGGTTTGNKSGIVIPYKDEWVAVQYTNATYNSQTDLPSYAGRYFNHYIGTNDEQKKGDAMLETKGWHNTTYSYTSGAESLGGMIRRITDGIFGFTNYWTYPAPAPPYTRVGYYNITYNHASRAVIINGEGI